MNVTGTDRKTPPDVWLVAALALAVVLVLASAPVVLRSLVALPILVAVPGYALTCLVVRADRDDSVGIGRAGVTVLRVTLPVLLGVLVLLADALTLNLLRISLSAQALVLGDAVFALVLLAIGYLPALRARPAGGQRRTAAQWRVAAGAVLSLGLLIGAVATARSLQPAPVRTPYEAVQLISPAPGADLVAAPGDPVSLGWSVTGFDGAAAGATPVLTVAGQPPAALKTELIPRSASGSADFAARGTATFTAPAAAGVYRVQVRIGTGSTVSTLLTVR